MNWKLFPQVETPNSFLTSVNQNNSCEPAVIQLKMEDTQQHHCHGFKYEAVFGGTW